MRKYIFALRGDRPIEEITSMQKFCAPLKVAWLMNKLAIKYVLIILITAFLSCEQNGSTNSTDLKSKISQKKARDTLANKVVYWLTPKNMTPLSFIQIMRKQETIADTIGVIVMKDSFPENWLKREDIDSLVKLVKSTDKCNCFLEPMSSYIPFNDSANVGGYAIKLIEAYKQQRKVSFGLYSCPKTNEKDADKLIRWWSHQEK
jgi:hypothetical protein